MKMNHHILHLQVSVHDANFVNLIDSVNDFSHHVPRLVFVDYFKPTWALELEEVQSLHPLSDYDLALLITDQINQIKNTVYLFTLLQHLNLSLKVFLEL